MIEKRQNSISIIGCGWLGLPLGKKLVALGWQVKGSTTRAEKLDTLKQNGIKPFLLSAPQDVIIENELFNVDFLVLNIPPGRKDPNVLDTYPALIKRILDIVKDIDAIKKLIFVSSTSVYGNDVDFIDENTVCKPKSNSGKAVFEAENVILKSGVPSIILRFGGLAGPSRHPGRFFAGQKELEIGSQSVNFLHLEDAINIIYYMITHSVENETFNVVAPIHPDKNEFYSMMTSSIGLEPPTFVKGADVKKREISVVKLLNTTDFKFKYPDPMKFTFFL